jgi:hypothetical protein
MDIGDFLKLNWKDNYWVKEVKENRWQMVGACYSTGQYWINFLREGPGNVRPAVRIEEYSDDMWKVKIGIGHEKSFCVTNKTKTHFFPDKQSAIDFAEEYMRDNP